MGIRERLPAALLPWLTEDFAAYLEEIGGMFAEVELYSGELLSADGLPDSPGWTVIVSPDMAPNAALAYMAQYVGERLPVGISDAKAREWIKDAPNQRRGTIPSIIAAAQRSLTGDRLVTLVERDGTVDTLTVITYTTQTPNPAQVLMDLRDGPAPVVAADVILNYEVLPGEAWIDVKNAWATWADVLAANQTWGDVYRLPGQTSDYRP